LFVVCLTGDVDKLLPAAEGSRFLVEVGELWKSAVQCQLVSTTLVLARCCGDALEEHMMDFRRLLSYKFDHERWRKEDPTVGFAFGMVRDGVTVERGGLFFSVQMFRFGRGPRSLTEKWLRVNVLEARQEREAMASYGMEAQSDESDAPDESDDE
jgi:hypothetical protein